jgi:hypothetical protein
MSEPTTPELSPRDAAIKKHLRRGHPLEAATRLADEELAPIPSVIPEATTTKKKKQPATE